MSQIKWANVLPDPRVERSKRHKLESIIVIVAAGAAAGMTSYKAMAQMASTNMTKLKEHIDLEAGCPSTVTLWRNFERVNSKGLIDFINNHKQSIFHIMNSLSINRKARKQRSVSEDKTPNLSIIKSMIDDHYMNLCYKQPTGKDIPTPSRQLSRALNETVKLSDGIISVAGKTNTTQTFKPIIENKKDYLIQISKHNKYLFEQVKSQLDRYIEGMDQYRTFVNTKEKEPGKGEIRVFSLFKQLKWVEGIEKWANAASMVAVQKRQTTNEKTKMQTNYYLCSRERPTDKELIKLTAQHFFNPYTWIVTFCKNEDIIQASEGLRQNRDIIKEIFSDW